MGLWGMAIIIVLLPHMAQMTEISPGFKIRITSRGLELCMKTIIHILIKYSARPEMYVTFRSDQQLFFWFTLNGLVVLSLVKLETQKFVEEELGGIAMPEMHGMNGNLQYSITELVTPPFNHCILISTHRNNCQILTLLSLSLSLSTHTEL